MSYASRGMYYLFFCFVPKYADRAKKEDRKSKAEIKSNTISSNFTLEQLDITKKKIEKKQRKQLKAHKNKQFFKYTLAQSSPIIPTLFFYFCMCDPM